MPRRKGQNTAASSFFSRHEIEQSGYGSKRARLTADSLLQFGVCGVCLRSIHPSEAMCATPSGHLYHRPCIVTYLGEQTLKLKQQRSDWEAQERAKASGPPGLTEAERVAAFKASETSARRPAAAGAAAAAAADAAASESIDALVTARGLRAVAGARDKWAEAAKATSYWRPEGMPDRVRAVVAEPPKRPPSPHSGRPLRLKGLSDLEPMRSGEDGRAAVPVPAGVVEAAVAAASEPRPREQVTSSSSTGTDVGRVACALTHDPIRHQQAVALRT